MMQEKQICICQILTHIVCRPCSHKPLDVCFWTVDAFCVSNAVDGIGFGYPAIVQDNHNWTCCRASKRSNALTQVVLQHKLSAPYVLQPEIAVLAQPSRSVKTKVKRKSNLLPFSFAQALHGVAICLSSLSSSPLKREFC